MCCSRSRTAYGYGTQGSPPSIPANATLWFVIDIVEVQ